MMNKETSFGPLLTPARDTRRRPKPATTFQLTIRNRLGAALKFASACDNNAELGAEAIKVEEEEVYTEGEENNHKGHTSKVHRLPDIPCPLCCHAMVPSSQFANVVPSEQDESACAHYMFSSRPSATSKLLHWHTKHCCKMLWIFTLSLSLYRYSFTHSLSLSLSLHHHLFFLSSFNWS
jgi:hypothetical protein